MNSIDIIKKGIVFGRREAYLSLCVLAYLLVSFSMLSLKISEGYLLVLQVFFLLLENYVTVAVYYAAKQCVFEGGFSLPGAFAKAGYFFRRVLSYKLLAGFFALLLFVFCLSMIELVKSSSLTAAGFITGFTMLWIAVPVYLLLLTFFAPLIIIADDAALVPSIRKSVVFMRANLAETVKLAVVAAPFWFFALFILKVYNEKGLLLPAAAAFCFVAVLEIVTVKVFLLFYKVRKEKNSNASFCHCEECNDEAI